jgi:hypothetical protein
MTYYYIKYLQHRLMNRNSMITALIAFSLVNANIAYAQQVFPSSTVQLTKTALGMTAAAGSLSAAATTIPRSHRDQNKI